MPLFYVAVREHAYTGLFYSDVVEAGSGEEALQLAAERATAPRPPPGPRAAAVVRTAVHDRRRSAACTQRRARRRGEGARLPRAVL